MAEVNYVCLCLIACFSAALAGELCYTHNSEFEWCDWGCCYYDDDAWTDNAYCCEDSSVGMIVGIVVGSLVVVAIIVGVVIAVCCCMRKNPGRRGVVYQPNAGTATVTTMAVQPGVNQTVMYGGQTTYPVAQPVYPGGQPAYPGVQSPYPQPLPSNVGTDTTQKWQQAPPSYDTLN